MSEREDCKHYHPTTDEYGRKNWKYGNCLNETKFNHLKKNFSIYNHKVCWMLNPKNAPQGCDDCSYYDHQNIILQKIIRIRSILNSSGVTRPEVWGMILEDWLHPPSKCECECTKKEGDTK